MKLSWSEAAKRDLRAITDCSVDRFGAEIAQRHVGRIVQSANEAAADPSRPRTLSARSRTVRAGSHVLILTVDPPRNRVTVARILHLAMDLDRHLPPDPDRA